MHDRVEFLEMTRIDVANIDAVRFDTRCGLADRAVLEKKIIETDDLMSPFQEHGHQESADITVVAGNENAHERQFLWVRVGSRFSLTARGRRPCLGSSLKPPI